MLYGSPAASPRSVPLPKPQPWWSRLLACLLVCVLAVGMMGAKPTCDESRRGYVWPTPEAPVYSCDGERWLPIVKPSPPTPKYPSCSDAPSCALMLAGYRCEQMAGDVRVCDGENWRALPKDLCNPADIETALWLALEYVEPAAQGNKLSTEDRLQNRDEHIQFIRAVQEACSGER
jgi:hypothetical protein